MPATGSGVNPSVGRLLLTQDDLIRDADEAFCRLFGFLSQALIGIRFDSLLTKVSQILFQMHFSPRLRLNGKADGVQFTLKSGSTENVKVVVSARAILVGNDACYELLISLDR